MAATSENNLSEITRISGGDLTREHRSLTIDNLNYGSDIDPRHFQSDGIQASQMNDEVCCIHPEQKTKQNIFRSYLATFIFYILFYCASNL